MSGEALPLVTLTEQTECSRHEVGEIERLLTDAVPVLIWRIEFYCVNRGRLLWVVNADSSGE